MPQQQFKILGEFVKWRRNQLDLSQAALAEKMGIDGSQISRIENGLQKEPDIVSIGKAINVRAGILIDLLSGDVTPEEARNMVRNIDLGLVSASKKEELGQELMLPLSSFLLDEDIARIHDYTRMVTERRLLMIERARASRSGNDTAPTTPETPPATDTDLHQEADSQVEFFRRIDEEKDNQSAENKPKIEFHQ